MSFLTCIYPDDLTSLLTAELKIFKELSKQNLSLLFEDLYLHCQI